MIGVRLEDVETGMTFFYSTMRPNLIQVFHIRKFCESQPRYSAFRSRGRGFLKLTYKERELSDESAHFLAEFKYPSLYENWPSASDYVQVELRAARTYEVSCGSITHTFDCHSEATVGDLRRSLALKCGISLDVLTISLGETALDDPTKLFSLQESSLRFSARGYVAACSVLFPVEGTVLDFISLVQNRSSSDIVHTIDVMIDGSRIEDDSWSERLTRGDVKCTVGTRIAGQAIDRRFEFKFESGPVRTFRIRSGCTLSYARYRIARIAHVPFELVELFWDANFENRVGF
jgi:hypothetical protein